MGRFIFKLPDVGEGTAEAEIVAWHVAVGEHVREDQLLVDVMTDKATVEMTSPVAGTIVALNASPGEMAVVGAPLVEFEVENTTVTEDQPASSPVAQPEIETKQSSVMAAPAVRLRAADMGIDLQQLRGSGPGGRVTHGDLDDYLANSGRSNKRPERSDTVEEIKLIGLRRKIAEKMQEAKRRIPHITYVEEIDMTALEALRKTLNETRNATQPKLTLLPFFIQALVRVLPDFPQFNAHFDDEAGVIKRFQAIHIGIATQTDAGLMVPVIRHAETLDLWQSASAVTAMAAKARDASAKREELTGSTITITSLGALGGIASTPIINLPEVAILAPNAIVERAVVRDGLIAIRKMINLSSAYDHRVIDGSDVAAFVKRLKTVLEHPALLFFG